MNKQEVISKLKSAIPKNNIDDYQRGEAAGLNFALLLLAELDEPKRPAVPRYVADFYESIKDDFEGGVYELCTQFYEDEAQLSNELHDWFVSSENKPIETLVMMHKFGYEVKKEKLYYVNIPNVYHGDFGYSETHDNYSFYNKSDATEIRFELTESEIKLEHEWAWEFAKEVEE